MEGIVRGFWPCLLVLSSILVTTHGGCQLPPTWAGEWFQLGSGKSSIAINSTHIESKGECKESDGDKFVFHDRTDSCYRCIVMHKRHNNVLQYKETYCESGRDLSSLCNEITGDATLLSMFRVDAAGVTCPFKSPPFSVVYSKGHGDCGFPASTAEACTDDTRLVFRFQACPDIHGTEAAVEELECLATWREGSYHYLVGRLHHKMATVDEERYRCFVYHKVDHIYQVAQSGEATCSGLITPNEGSRNMKLSRIEGQHYKCKFPSWVTVHYHWRSLDYSHSFHFSHRNASLKISSRGGVTETKLVCHNLEVENAKMARIVVHVVSGCDGGYKCMTIHRRDSHVIQMQQSGMYNNPEEACLSTNYESSSSASTITMITGTLPTVKCPLEGRYAPSKIEPETTAECTQQTNLQLLLMGCSPSQDIMEFESTCKTIPKTSYSCHGSWRENSTTYVVGSPVSRHSTDARHYCFILTHSSGGLTVERVAETCAITSRPTEFTFNITEIGKCSETSSGEKNTFIPAIAAVALLVCLYQAHR
ncbi:uncharacterized protein [Halyomorpha halys]|uniref:uncharacterized protein n=1 Tax=Halyomorpha halys TaxID=286706 RepID=UPI0006D52627|nr:uncharacterized protein LOC106692433 [Halyomorpha halys]